MKRYRLAAIAAVGIIFAALASSAEAKPANALNAFKGGEFRAVARSGGKIVAVGTAQSCRWSAGACNEFPAPRAPLVARFTRSGKLDESFNGTGFRVLDEEVPWTRIIGIVVRPDRSLLIGYRTLDGVRLISLTRKGKPDRGFGEDGRAAIPGTLFVPLLGGSWPHGMVALGDGRVAIAGQAVRHLEPDEFGVLVIDANGEIDTAFGDEGVATVGPPIGPLEGYSGAVALQRDRGILALGATTDPESDFHALTAARFKFDGKLDPTFGTGGIARFTPLHEGIKGFAVGGIIPFGKEGIAAACDVDGIRSIDPDGAYPGSLFESGADAALRGCIDLADAARIGDGIVAAGAIYDDYYKDGLPHPFVWQYDRAGSGKIGPPRARRALPRSYRGFNNAVAPYRDGFVVAGSLLSDRCQPPWRPGGTRCQVATLTRLTDHGRVRSFGRNGIATLGGGRVCVKPHKRRCR